jgi:hypothetical protein
MVAPNILKEQSGRGTGKPPPECYGRAKLSCRPSIPSTSVANTEKIVVTMVISSDMPQQ